MQSWTGEVLPSFLASGAIWWQIINTRGVLDSAPLLHIGLDLLCICLPGLCIILSWHFCEHTGKLHFLHLSSSTFFSFPKHETQTGVEFGAGATIAGSSTKMFSPVVQWKISIFV